MYLRFFLVLSKKAWQKIREPPNLKIRISQGGRAKEYEVFRARQQRGKWFLDLRACSATNTTAFFFGSPSQGNALLRFSSRILHLFFLSLWGVKKRRPYRVLQRTLCSDINSFEIFDMCFARDMPFGLICRFATKIGNLYHIEFDRRENISILR